MRLDPATGAVTGSAGVLAPLASPRVAVDAAGRVYVGNGWAASGQDPALVAGQPVWGQFWFRDPPASAGIGLTNGLAFELGP